MTANRVPAARRPLRGSVVLVTGGAGDIGSAVAAELAREGALVKLLDLRPAAEIEALLTRLGEVGNVDYHQVDVTNRTEVERVLDEIGDVDIAIGNAAVSRGVPFLELSPEEWRQVIDVNLTGCFNLGQAVAQRMVRGGIAGRIIFTGSWVQAVPWPEIAAYCASKAGLEMLARCMARELAEHRITVNVIAPGIVDGGLSGRQREVEPQYVEMTRNRIPLGAIQSLDSVAQAMLFLCGPGADYMTGSTVLIDGGCSLFKFQ